MAALLALTASLACAGGALAAGGQVMAADNAYDVPAPGTYTINQGQQLTLQNVGPANMHDVWSRLNGPDGKKLFISPTISPGQNTVVNGTQYLTTGSYAFFCNVHPFEMSGNLAVTGAGTPQPRPSINVTVVSGKLDKVASKGKLALKVQALTAANDVSLEAKLGKVVIGTIPDLDVPAGQTRKATLKLNKAGKSKLAAKDKATIKVTGNVAFGSPDTVKKKLT